MGEVLKLSGRMVSVPMQKQEETPATEEICLECGESVAFGSGKFVNRIPVCDSVEENADKGVDFPQGGYICYECECKAYDDWSGEELDESRKVYGGCPLPEKREPCLFELQGNCLRCKPVNCESCHYLGNCEYASTEEDNGIAGWCKSWTIKEEE